MLGEGQVKPCNINFNENSCVLTIISLHSYKNIFLFDTALVIYKLKKRLPIRRAKHRPQLAHND